MATGIERKIESAIRDSRKRWLRDFSTSQQDLKNLYRDTYNEIRRILAFYAEADDQISFSNLDQLVRDVKRMMDGTGRERNKQIEAGIAIAVLAGINFYKAPLDIVGIQTEQLSAVAGVVKQETIKEALKFTYKDGLDLSDRLWRLDRGAKQKVVEVIESGVALGSGARVSAQSLLRRGEPLSTELLKKMGLNTSAKIGSDVLQLFTPKGKGNVVHNALRVMRTEISKANRMAFLKTGDRMDAVIGHRWHLSASHPRPDICDVYATRDNDGLGPGGYLKVNYPKLPAHPEDLCFDTPIFSIGSEVLN